MMPKKSEYLKQRESLWVSKGWPGSYPEEALAAYAYDLAAVKAFGDHAQTNFPVPGSTAWIY
ncbi:MAG TPA: hypothetical protein VJ725_21495 [Thermoanaerobaculia bacterium]|nr:hypothetical protein [Thermoanaerobaculia bacterium]